MTNPVTAGADGVSAPIDLTGIDPHHWADARQRVATLCEWCATRRHTRAQCVDAADRLGISVKHFERLVVTWKRYGDVRRISGAGTGRGGQRGSIAIPAATRAAVDAAIEAKGPDARFVDVLTDAADRCHAACTPAASSGMVHYLQMRARARRTAPTRKDDEIRIARVACFLPVLVGYRPVETPELVLAVSAPSGRILSHRLVLKGDVMAAARHALRTIPAGSTLPVTLAANLGIAIHADAPAASLARTRAWIKMSTGSELLTALLGSHIDSIPIRHRQGGRVRPWRAGPLTPADARRAIDDAVAAHNLARTPQA